MDKYPAENSMDDFRTLAKTQIPIVTGKTVDAVVFGTDPVNPDVIALIHRSPQAHVDHALVRLHSACITSEVLGSVKCDCAIQLNTALSMISRTDWGVLVYLLRHEGRGIGLVNKIRAYALQAEGMDTVDANLALGFGADDRDFKPAVRALELLGVRRLALLTNNPEKESVLRSAGFEVVERIPMDVPITEHNRDYLATKRSYFGHKPPLDPITEFLTREAAAGVFAAEVKDARERGSALSVLAVHIQQVDRWRATHGLTLAERRVATLADAIKQCKELLNMPVARLRHDCFLVLLRQTDGARAQVLAEQLGQMLQMLHLPGSEGDASPSQVIVSVAGRAAGEASDEVIAEALEAIDSSLDASDIALRPASLAHSREGLACSN